MHTFCITTMQMIDVAVQYRLWPSKHVHDLVLMHLGNLRACCWLFQGHTRSTNYQQTQIMAVSLLFSRVVTGLGGNVELPQCKASTRFDFATWRRTGRGLCLKM